MTCPNMDSMAELERLADETGVIELFPMGEDDERGKIALAMIRPVDGEDWSIGFFVCSADMGKKGTVYEHPGDVPTYIVQRLERALDYAMDHPDDTGITGEIAWAMALAAYDKLLPTRQ